ncbi:MAG: hypothetical protein HUU38_21370 [Anaerolineales bacterium]|jgi:hypothetical protein|nr:hypothetical protein [Anaerolineales bacterium]
MIDKKSPVLWFVLFLLATAGFAVFGPAEKSLGTNVRVVYLHGAWVWTALAGIVLAAGFGLGGLLLNRETWHAWSRALGRTGLFFWITYLPISMWAMQTNWNGLFLAEPRWRVAFVFSLGGLALQIGLTLLEDPRWASGANLLYAATLFLALQNAEQVMHPPSPILTSDAWRIQIFFGGLTALTLLAGSQMARWWRQRERPLERAQ